MKNIKKLHNSIDFNNLIYYYKGPTADVKFDNFIGAIILFDERKSSRIKLDNAKKNQASLESKLKDKRIGDRKPDKQNSGIKNITNLYNVRDDFIKFLEDCSTMMLSNGHGRRLKILTSRQMIQRLPIALAQVKESNTSEDLLNEICQIIYFLYQAK